MATLSTKSDYYQLQSRSAFWRYTMNKKESRLRRAKSTRAHIRKLGMPRLSVHRTGQHLYAQVFDASGVNVVAAASTVQKTLAEGLNGTKNVEAAAAIGKAI